MKELTVTPGPNFFHGYAQPPPEGTLEQQSATAGCQTDVSMVMEDILLRAEQAEEEDPIPNNNMPDVVNWATETDERANFYTGIRSKNLLNGKRFTLEPTHKYTHLVLICK